ncbi:MAG: hypothetical protein NC347_08825 [Clostridium sp.]|nr:hypothetical protein [Clostridium sp.]
MKRVLKVTGAICLGIFIWVLLMVCLLLIWKTKAGSVIEGLGAIPTEAPSDLTGNKVEEDSEENTNLTINVTGNPFSTQESEEDNIYYGSMQEALLKSNISLDLEEQYRRNIDEEIKVFENDKYALLFYRSIKDKKEEAFNYVRFNVDTRNGDKMYQFEQMRGTTAQYDSLYLSNAKEVIENFIIGSEIMGSIGINPETERFIYGEVRGDFFEEGESIESLKIEGQKPDEIIEYESFGKTWYFWYYNDLQSDKKYDELEFTIKEN